MTQLCRPAPPSTLTPDLIQDSSLLPSLLLCITLSVLRRWIIYSYDNINKQIRDDGVSAPPSILGVCKQWTLDYWTGLLDWTTGGFLMQPLDVMCNHSVLTHSKLIMQLYVHPPLAQGRLGKAS